MDLKSAFITEGKIIWVNKAGSRQKSKHDMNGGKYTQVEAQGDGWIAFTDKGEVHSIDKNGIITHVKRV